MQTRSEFASERIALGTFALIVVVALLVSGCSSPRVEGGVIPHPPTGFAFDANATQARNVYPGGNQLSQRAWGTFGEQHDSIYITEYEGSSTRTDAQGARDAQEARYGGYMQYGPLEDLTIDGRPAWGWLETQMYKGRLASLEYKAVVSCDDRSFAVEFYGSTDEWRDADKLRAVVSTFEIARPKPNMPAILMGAVIGLGGIVVAARTRTRG